MPVCLPRDSGITSVGLHHAGVSVGLPTVSSTLLRSAATNNKKRIKETNNKVLEINACIQRL